MPFREREVLRIVTFLAEFFRLFFSFKVNHFEKLCMNFIVRNPGGLFLAGNCEEDAENDGYQGNKEPVTFFESHTYPCRSGVLFYGIVAGKGGLPEIYSLMNKRYMTTKIIRTPPPTKTINVGLERFSREVSCWRV